jgi:hypothetical protein
VRWVVVRNEVLSLGKDLRGDSEEGIRGFGVGW